MNPTDAQITRWAHRYRVPVEDARQECALWQLECKTKIHTLAMRIRKQQPTPGIDYDYVPPKGEGLPIRDTLAKPIQPIDSTTEKATKALAYWISDGTLTQAQAEAIYLCDIEGLSYTMAGERCGCAYHVVSYHHRNGLKRLQERYAQLQGIS